VSSGQLVAQSGDFAAELLVAPVGGFEPANQGSGRGPLLGRHRRGGRSAVVVWSRSMAARISGWV
jgi:hypothetical protein